MKQTLLKLKKQLQTQQAIASCVCLLLTATMPAYVKAATNTSSATYNDIQFALIRYQSPQWNPRPNGLPRLAWLIGQRTSIVIDMHVATVDLENPQLFYYPLLVWQGIGGFDALPEIAINNLRDHLNMGGSLLIDNSEGIANSAFEISVRRELKRLFPQQSLQPIPQDHVFYKSFYLLGSPALDGLFIENRLAVVLSVDDLAGAMARDAFGEWEYHVGAGGNATREQTYRLGINWVMYALCLDYKADQVHIPFILQRRR